eukprot:scaffold29814_cov48-Attheya_sp.AAC.5
MPLPTVWARVRHTLGRALRESGQALDRVGHRGETHAVNASKFGGENFYLGEPYKFNDHLSRHRTQFPLLTHGRPRVDPQVAFLAPCATLIGSVSVGPDASIWYGAVLRADRCNNGMTTSESADREREEAWKKIPQEERRQADLKRCTFGGGGVISIGARTNIQDGSVVTAVEDHATIGDGVTVGHLAQIHSATVGDNCLIGMGAVVMELVSIQPESFIAAGAVVPRGTTIPSGQLWVGNPARKLRDLTPEERQKLFYQADEYVKVAKGQSQVMELGGNMPDSLVEHLMIGNETDDTSSKK